VVTAFDVVDAGTDHIVIDISCNALNEEHAQEITAALAELPGVTVRKVSDRTFLVHLGGKIEVSPKVSLRTRDDLSRAYTPGVARVCLAIAANPEDARRLTIKRNTVAVVTDGSAVLGLGNIGAAAALPVMEGKAALFKRFAGVDAWPVCLDTQDTEEIIRTVCAIAPVYGGINLEDIAAPRCFEIEARLREMLDIPVFHDDQHGTAIVVLAALRNALRVVGKRISDCKIVVCGVGAAGSAIIRLMLPEQPGDVMAVDVDGIVYPGRPGLETDQNLTWIAEHTNAGRQSGTLADAMVGADLFIGVSAPNLFGADELRTMNSDAVVFAGQPGSGGRPGDRPAARRRGRHRAVGLPEPDQQRAGLSRGVPGAAGRAAPHHHRQHAARGGGGDRLGGRRAEPVVHRAQRVRPFGVDRGGQGGPRGGVRSLARVIRTWLWLRWMKPKPRSYQNGGGGAAGYDTRVAPGVPGTTLVAAGERRPSST
jgi:malate dehydrogenase (oxaloacetate-decarboxylating)